MHPRKADKPFPFTTSSTSPGRKKNLAITVYFYLVMSSIFISLNPLPRPLLVFPAFYFGLNIFGRVRQFPHKVQPAPFLDLADRNEAVQDRVVPLRILFEDEPCDLYRFRILRRLDGYDFPVARRYCMRFVGVGQGRESSLPLNARPHLPA
jgi:hypothetical protein